MKTGKTERQAGYFKAKVLTDHKAETTDRTLEQAIANDRSIIFTYGSTSNVNSVDIVDIHISEKSTEKTKKENLKWVYIAISNAKRNFVGTFNKIKTKYLQLYLNEFMYRLNKRYFGKRICDRILIVSITAKRR